MPMITLLIHTVQVIYNVNWRYYIYTYIYLVSNSILWESSDILASIDHLIADIANYQPQNTSSITFMNIGNVNTNAVDIPRARMGSTACRYLGLSAFPGDVYSSLLYSLLTFARWDKFKRDKGQSSRER